MEKLSEDSSVIKCEMPKTILNAVCQRDMSNNKVKR